MRTVRKALEREGIRRVSGKYPAQALDRVIPHLKHYKGEIPAGETPANIDQRSGLSYAQLLTREKALEQERRNEEEQAVREKKWVLAADMCDILRMITNKLEQYPGRARSEAGLTDTQSGVIQKLMDGIRNEIADSIEKMGPKSSQTNENEIGVRRADGAHL
jgi:phage terminase Nu1 subunit (DNA packaging protein)